MEKKYFIQQYSSFREKIRVLELNKVFEKKRRKIIEKLVHIFFFLRFL